MILSPECPDDEDLEDEKLIIIFLKLNILILNNLKILKKGS
jgi:hypothetical protein